MKASNLLKALVLITGASAALSTNVIDSWDVEDLRDYLRDTSVSYDEKKATLQELRDLSKKQWQLRANQRAPTYPSEPSWFSFESIKQKVLGASTEATKTVNDWYSQADFDNLKGWVFATWSTTELEKLLQAAGIKYDKTKSVTRSQLEKLAQDNYDAIAKHFKSSGKYPGDWLYSSWDKSDLEKWLKQYGVEYSSTKASKDELVRKVRDNAYRASQYAIDERDSVLDSLDLTSKSLFDKAGELKDDVFNSWTESQLYSWLKTHGVELQESAKNNQKELLALASKHSSDLKGDIDYWVSKASKTASPYLEKGSKKADEVINDTFLVGVDDWSKSRLRAFLEARDVKIPMFSTRYDLVNLVKENKYKPIKNFNSDAFFEGWSKENVQKWLEEQGSNVQQGSQDLYSRANEAYKSFVSGAEGLAQTAQEKVADATGYGTKKATLFDKWSDSDLKKYLSSFGIKTKTTKREELLAKAKQNTVWFINGDGFSSSASDSANGVRAQMKYVAASFFNNALYYWRALINYIRLQLKQ